MGSECPFNPKIKIIRVINIIIFGRIQDSGIPVEKEKGKKKFRKEGDPL